MHKRKHIRLRGFDYRSADSYFITICTKDFECAFGEIRNGLMSLSELGNRAALNIQEIPVLRQNTFIDEFVVMPNHLHLVLSITKTNPTRYVESAFAKPIANSVSIIINRYKGSVKKWANDNGYKSFEWQPRFYDHIIRSQESYDKIIAYIQDNPRRWNEDRYRL